MTASTSRRPWYRVAGDTVAVTCWCEAQYVRVPKHWVGRRTRSCGKPGCTGAVLEIAKAVNDEGPAARSEALERSAHR